MSIASIDGGNQSTYLLPPVNDLLVSHQSLPRQRLDLDADPKRLTVCCRLLL